MQKRRAWDLLCEASFLAYRNSNVDRSGARRSLCRRHPMARISAGECVTLRMDGQIESEGAWWIMGFVRCFSRKFHFSHAAHDQIPVWSRIARLGVRFHFLWKRFGLQEMKKALVSKMPWNDEAVSSPVNMANTGGTIMNQNMCIPGIEFHDP